MKFGIVAIVLAPIIASIPLSSCTRPQYGSQADSSTQTKIEPLKPKSSSSPSLLTKSPQPKTDSLVKTQASKCETLQPVRVIQKEGSQVFESSGGLIPGTKQSFLLTDHQLASAHQVVVDGKTIPLDGSYQRLEVIDSTGKVLVDLGALVHHSEKDQVKKWLDQIITNKGTPISTADFFKILNKNPRTQAVFTVNTFARTSSNGNNEGSATFAPQSEQSQYSAVIPFSPEVFYKYDPVESSNSNSVVAFPLKTNSPSSIGQRGFSGSPSVLNLDGKSCIQAAFVSTFPPDGGNIFWPADTKPRTNYLDPNKYEPNNPEVNKDGAATFGILTKSAAKNLRQQL